MGRCRFSSPFMGRWLFPIYGEVPAEGGGWGRAGADISCPPHLWGGVAFPPPFMGRWPEGPEGQATEGQRENWPVPISPILDRHTLNRALLARQLLLQR